MKKIILHNISTPLGIGANLIKIEGNKKWLYLMPSNSLIPEIKRKIITVDKNLLDVIEFMTFDQMMRKTMYDTHTKMLTPSEQEIIVKKAVEQVNKENGLIYFKNSVEKSGWISKIEMYLGEIKRSAISSESLFDLWKNHLPKYKELANIYQAYQKILKQYSLIDHEEPYFKFLSDDKSYADFFQSYSGVITEQFYDFSSLQMKALSRIGNLNIDVDIHFAIDEIRKDLFQSVYNNIDYLTNLGFKKENASINIDNKTNSNNINNQLKESLFFPFPDKVDAKGNITIIATSGRKQEIEEISAEIKDLVLNKDISVDDISIIVPQLSKYQNLIERYMSKAGIPTQIVRKESLIKNPLVQSLISFFKAAKNNKDEWINILASPYFKWVENIDSTLLIKMFRELSYPMSKDEWIERFVEYTNTEDSSDFLKYDKVMKQIYHLMTFLPESSTNNGFIDFLNNLENELKIKTKLKDSIVNNIDDKLAYRDFKAYEKWQDLKQEMVSLEQYLSTDDEMTYWNWFNMLVMTAEKSEYNFTQGKQEGVSLLQPNQIRGREYEVVFVLGLVEGEFPRPIKNDWLLPDSERYLLKNHGYQFNFSGDYINSQKFQFFQSVTAANNKLYLVYSSKSEAGGDNLRSFYIEELIDLFIDNSITYKVRELSDKVVGEWDRCVNDQQFVNKIYYDIQKYQLPEEKLKQALNNYGFYERKSQKKLMVINQGLKSEYERKNLLKSNFDGNILNKNNKAEIQKTISTNIWSTTQLNLARRCRFAYFAQYILKLSEWKEQEESLTSLEKGDILHRILERFFANFYYESKNIFEVDLEKEYLKQVEKIATEEWDIFQLQKERIIDRILGDIDWEILKRNLYQIISHEIWWRKRSTTYYYPKHLEYSFGIDSESGKKETEIKLINRNILLRGRIDRVDISNEGKFIIYDYKSGSLPTNEAIKEGVNLQLPLYLLVLEAVCNYTVENAVGAAFYGKGNNNNGEFKDNRNNGIWKSSLAEMVGISRRVASSIDDTDWYNWLNKIKELIEELLINLESGDFSVLPVTECPSYCPYKRICRKDDQIIKVKKRIREAE